MDSNVPTTKPAPDMPTHDQSESNAGPAIQPAQSKKLTKPMTPDSVRQLLLRIATFELAPESLLQSVAGLLDEYNEADGEQKETISSKLNTKLKQAYALVALDKHHLISNVMDDDKYRTLVIEIANQLIAEYECKTVGEKMLAETAAWAFCRMLECSQTLSGIHRVEYLSTEKSSFFGMLSKEVDRANRQYLAAIHTLRQLKQPPLSVTFKTHNAFIAHDQNINGAPATSQSGVNNEQQ